MFLTLMCGLVLLSSTYFASPVESPDYPDGICQCAVFEANADPANSKPVILKHTEIDMPIVDESRKECADICIALAKAAKDNADAVLCEAIKKDVDNLQVTLYTHLTGEPWVSTNKTNKIPVCCRNNKPITCAGLTHN